MLKFKIGQTALSTFPCSAPSKSQNEQRRWHPHPDWPQWRYDLAALAQPLADVSRAQGLLLGRLTDVGIALRDMSDPLARGVLLKTEGGGCSHKKWTSCLRATAHIMSRTDSMACA